MSTGGPLSLLPSPSDITQEEATRYEAVVVPRFSSLLAQGLIAEIPNGSRARILDVGCGTGVPSLGILKRLGDGGQVVGVDPSSPMLDFARAKALDELGRHVFYKRERIPPLKFGDEVFDIAVSNFTYSSFPDYPSLLREMGRVVRVGGQIHIAEATRGTFAEITDVLREVLVQHDREDLVPRLDAMNELFPSESTLKDALESVGFVGVRATTEKFRIPFRSAEEAFGDELMQLLYFKDLLRLTELTSSIPELLNSAVQTLTTYHARGPLSLTVYATVISALR